MPCLLPLLCLVATAQSDWPLTRAERTNYGETSHYGDVIDFIRALQKKGAPISLQFIGTSAEGKAFPLVIASIPPITSPAEARRSGKPIFYIQANIHAGEVEGKEAAQIVLRRLCQMGAKGPLGKIVLLVDPIYNIDGNEKFGPMERNRPEQDGPPMVGVRANGQGMDLNRDAVKAETPEMRAALDHIYTTWDPDVMMDLHTTDGTRHGYDLTYLPPTHPAGEPSIYHFGYDVLMPTIAKDLKSKYKFEIFPYGDVSGQGPNRAWRTTGPEGRYCTNYLGLRNRIGILSEAATYISFHDRVLATDRFVMSTLEYVASHPKQITDLTRGADARVVSWGLDPSKSPDLAVRTELASRGEDEVWLEKLGPGETHGFGRPKKLEKVKMPIFDRYRATMTARLPAGYFIPESESATIELLKRHGIVVERVKETWRGELSRFMIKEVVAAATTFQNHHLTKLEGEFQAAEFAIEPGTYFVRTAQPLGILAFHILEPQSIDGAVGWEFIKDLKANGTYPILKLPKPAPIVTDRSAGP